jgi:hypothetical protein
VINWNDSLRVKATGKRAELASEPLNFNGCHRVFIPSGPGHISTFWLYDDNGICRVDGKPGPMDIENDTTS